ncbi:hypothetical protein K469DRAFT_722769 [Zopfia rhizophila CBS 207.26]|uniref:Uncharacterized protein n=1 Tax=Zopfia rhizophila CBS 207.26 TaxID=1314779 RepID=A0A6A6EWH3_9PEZI|nr:hypothetical protein K469DRAFT_722769 [Zopfia rhizophila CBS 207.26]
MSKRNRQTTQYTCELRILKDVKLFTRHSGPDLSDLRNYPEPIHSSDYMMSSSQSSLQSRKRGSATTLSTKPTTNTINTKSTGVYDRDFQQHMVDYDVYLDEYEFPDGSVPAKPNHWEEFRKLKRADAHAAKEKQVSESVIPIIEGKIRDAKCRSGGIPFTNLEPLTDGTLKFKSGNPDVYYVRDELSSKIIPSTQHDLPMAPNFFLAAKGPDRSAAVAKRQACYNGALGARGMHSLLSYKKDEPVYNNNAYAITSTYHDGTLKMYTSHVAQPRSPGGRPQYHMTQLRFFAITDTRDTCAAGLQANEAIKQANERANSAEAEAPTGDTGASPALSFVTAVSETEAYTMSQESRTSLNEDSNTLEDFEESDSSIEEIVDYTLPAKRSSKRSKRQKTQRKRRNADVSSGAGHSDGSAVIPRKVVVDKWQISMSQRTRSYEGAE